MSVSTALLTDLGTIITNGPAAATKANCNAAAGPIMDYPGNCNLAYTKLQELVPLLQGPNASGGMIGDTDSTDSANLALLQGILNVITGGDSPSDSVITDIGTVITNGPNSATKAKAIAAAGTIMDYQGNCELVKIVLQEIYNLLYKLEAVTDAATDSANHTLFANLLLAFD